jgi:hypothetical protein
MFFVFHFLMLRFYSKKDSSRFAGELHWLVSLNAKSGPFVHHNILLI